MKSVASATGMTMAGLRFRQKSLDSFMRKANDPENFGKIPFDVVRYTMLGTNSGLSSSTNSVLRTLRSRGYTVIEVKNSWDTFSESNPYRGINVKLISSNNVPLELQFHTRQSFRLKNGRQHEIYEMTRPGSKVKLTMDEKRKLEKESHSLAEKLKRPKDVDKVRNRKKVQK